MLEQNQAKRHPPGLFDYCLVVDRERCIDSLPAISDDDEVSGAAVIAGAHRSLSHCGCAQELLRDVALFCAPRGTGGSVPLDTHSGLRCWTFALVRRALPPSAWPER